MKLRIEEPADGQTMVGAPSVRLRSTLTSSGHPALFYKWYSSLVSPADMSKTPPDASIQPPGGADPLNFITSLPLGSQAITFTAKDVSGDTKEALRNVQNAGMAGGGQGNPSPCVVHVCVATILAPAAGASLSKANATLVAQAPSNWSDAAYQAINQLQYRWKFAPQGAPAGRQSAEFVPSSNQLVFEHGAKGYMLTFKGALPAALSTGNYQMTLRVENKANPAVGHEVSIPVVLTV